jgi:hypothetical protein
MAAHSAPDLLLRTIDVIASVDFVGLLMNNVITNTSADATLRNAAASCLLYFTRLCSSFRSILFADPGLANGESESALDVLARIEPSFCSLLTTIVRKVGMPSQSAQSCNFRGRHLLRVSIRMLHAICLALPTSVWSRFVLSIINASLQMLLIVIDADL